MGLYGGYMDQLGTNSKMLDGLEVGKMGNQWRKCGKFREDGESMVGNQWEHIGSAVNGGSNWE